MVEVDSKDGSLVGVPNSKDLTTYYSTQGKRYDKQPDGNWKDTDGHLWSQDDSGNFSIVKRNPETVTIGQNFADSYNSISDWFSKPIIVAGDEDTLGGYDGEYTTTPSEQIQIASVPLLWSNQYRHLLQQVELMLEVLQAELQEKVQLTLALKTLKYKKHLKELENLLEV